MTCLRLPRARTLCRLAAALLSLVGSTTSSTVPCVGCKPKIIVQERAFRHVEPGFPVGRVRVAKEDVVRAEVAKDKRRVSLVGLRPGQSDILLVGSDGMTRAYTVTVVSSTQGLIAALRRALENVPEVTIQEDGLGGVVLTGTVCHPARWQILQKVLEHYREQVLSLVEYEPSPGRILALTQALTQAGFSVEPRPDAVGAQTPGKLFLHPTEGVLHIKGAVHSQAMLERLKAILAAHGWRVHGPGDRGDGREAGRVVLAVSVAPAMLEIDVCFIALTQAEERILGVNLAKNGLLAVDATQTALTGDLNGAARVAGTYTVRSGLAGTLNVVSNVVPGSKTVAEGYLIFRNGETEYQQLHQGGTLKVRVTAGNGADAVAALEDIDYGLILKAKGGLLNDREVALDVVLELSYPLASGQDYDLRRSQVASTVVCRLGHTIVMGGANDQFEGQARDGVPILRRIPIVNWLFSERRDQKRQMRVLVLLSPQLAPLPTPSDPLSVGAEAIRHAGDTPVRDWQRLP